MAAMDEEKLVTLCNLLSTLTRGEWNSVCLVMSSRFDNAVAPLAREMERRADAMTCGCSATELQALIVGERRAYELDSRYRKGE